MDLQHNYLFAVSPPGEENRVWKCRYCGQAGLLKTLLSSPCLKSRPVSDEDLLAALRDDPEDVKINA